VTDPAVARNREALRALEERVATLARQGEDALAAAWAQVAGDLAWHSHPGVMASPAIDGALEEIGRRACPRGTRAAGEGRRRVLHVVTECGAVGGHSRMAWRWIERDAASAPTLALTRQRAPLPAPLAAAVAARGGAVRHIRGHDLIARARALAELVDAADLVVLHVHPLEVAAPLALADREGRPPVLLVNHADHCFWLGAGVADLVVSPRPAASRTAVARRGVPAARTAVLPVPAEASTADADRAAARRALGVADDDCVLLAMAAPYKLARIDDLGLLDLVEPVLAAAPRARLLAVGPDDAGEWAAARAHTGGRVRALGTLPDPSAALAAADVFLDGYPCSSLTAVLEAAALGIPPVSYQPPRPQAATYDVDEPALGGAHLRATTVQEYAALLAALIAEPDARARAGEAARSASAAMRDRAAWTARMEDLYARAALLATVPPGPGRTPAATADHEHEDAFLQRLHEASGMSVASEAAAARGGDAFPCDPRRGLTIVAHARDDRDGIARLLSSAVETCDEVDEVTAVVIDDASGDGTAELLAGLGGDVRVVRNDQPLGPAASWPAGLAHAAGEAVLLVTSDVTLTPGWLPPLAEALAEPGVSAVAPAIAGATGHETCVLASLPALRAGAALVAVRVGACHVLGGQAAPYAGAPA
jgi:glycosyltransferase involved in cell wall biosynthesis